SFRISAPTAKAVTVVCECLTLEQIATLKQQQSALAGRSATDPELVKVTKAIQATRANQGERALAKDANGVWTLTIGPLDADMYEYHFNVDGTDTLDQRNPIVKYNSRPNLIESLLEVPGNSPMFYDVRPVP